MTRAGMCLVSIGGNPLPVDAYLLIVEQLLDHGISEADIRQMICRNTAFLLGLEETN